MKILKTIFTLIVGVILTSCGGSGGGDSLNTTPLNLPKFDEPQIPLEFIISGHNVNLVNENCEYTNLEDIVNNCLEEAEDDNLSGNNNYVITYRTEVPNREDYVIDRVHTKITRLIDGEIIDQELSINEWWGNPDGLYIDLNYLFKIYDYALCGEYEFDVWAIDKAGHTTPVYTHLINITNNCNDSPQEYAISAHTVYKVTEDCQFTEWTDIIQNCLELADDNNLSGNNLYMLNYNVQVPNNEIYEINRVSTQLVRLADSQVTEWETDFSARSNIFYPYVELYDPFVIYNTASCGDYVFNITALNTDDQETPVYTYNIKVTTNCY